MTKCSFYRQEAMVVRTTPQRSDRREGPPKRVMAGFCMHRASPVKREAALNGGQLVCGGDLGKCPIADKL
jgi:hypothetical protein